MKASIFLILTTSLLFAGQLPEERFTDEVDLSQHSSGERYARVTYADKYAYILHEDEEEEQAIRNVPVVAGDFFETRANTYAEMEYIDGTVMQIADRSEVEFQAINEIYDRESLTIVKLHKGGVFLHVREPLGDNISRVYRIDTESGSAYIEAPGIYHVLLEGPRMKLKTFRGFAELSGEEDSVPIYSGEYSTIRGMASPVRVRPFSSFHTNKFEQWAYGREPYHEGVSAGYVDPEISAYSRDLDENGEWRYSDELAVNIWVPYVETSWRPYNHGYWSTVGGLMTWVSYDSFGWVTHHYGRWGWSSRFGWYWRPGRHYSPAWVAWSTYDTYVGWCPLGWSNRPYYYGFYNGHYRPNTVIINNHNNYWNYVSSTNIVNRDRNYTYRKVNPRNTRVISRASVYVTRDDYRSGKSLTRVVSNPKVNRERAAVRRANSSASLVVRGQNSRSDRLQIKSRATGTRASSRFRPQVTRSSPTQNTRRATTNRQSNSNDYSVNQRNSTTRYESTSRPRRSQEVVPDNSGTQRRYRPSTRNSSSRNSTRRNSVTYEATPDKSNQNVRQGASGQSNNNTQSARPNQNHSRRTNAVRPSNSRSPRSNAVRPRNNTTSRSNVVRPRNNASSRSEAVRPRNNTSSRSNATRPRNNTSSRSNATRPRTNNSRSSATRSRATNSRSNATRQRSQSSRPNVKRKKDNSP